MKKIIELLIDRQVGERSRFQWAAADCQYRRALISMTGFI